ncbi:Cytochrome P450 3A4 [Apophysomyces sp. BC1034]|nr:Cytochrome P450 3A4 [Apophysomyces sp. BC1021]KAG0186561.1 Cytochrome P450 3A4 [Apophysomyces sp. BC1034]
MPVNIFGKLAQRLFEVIDKTDGRVDVPDMMGRYAFDAVTMAGFDFNADAIGDPDSEWVRLYNAMTSGAFHPFYFLFPIFDTTLRWMFPSRVKVHQGVGHFFAKVEEIIAEKRENLRKGRVSSLDNNEKDLCTLLLEAEMDGSGEGLTNAEIKNDLVTYILAGEKNHIMNIKYERFNCKFLIYEMTPSAYTIDIQDVQAKAREEVLSYLGSEPVDINPTVAQSKEMPYLNMVIKESLRLLSPAISTSPRYATEDCELGGHFIPKGTVVSVHITALQHDGQRWEDPEKFIPERFDISKTKIANSYMPFGNGQRQCIGMNMSLAEQRVLLSMLRKSMKPIVPEH